MFPAAGCQEVGGVRLVPVYPDDRPEILSELGIESLEVQFLPQDPEPAGEQRWVTVQRGGRLSLQLPPGSWKALIRGVGPSREVRGETLPFAVEAGVVRRVPFFLGEAGAFNLARLEPAEVAGQLADLSGHSATLFPDEDGRPRILVAGGRRGDSPSADAFLIDPVAFTIERAPSLGCARADHTALLLEEESGRRVVLAGGEGSCGNQLDVFDPAARSFSLIGVCGVSDSRPIVAEVVAVSGQFEQTGRLIAPGNPRCVVDPFTGQGEFDVPAVENGPDAPAYAVANSQGQVLVITNQRLFVDEAEQGRSCVEGGEWIRDASWPLTEERLGGHLIFLGNDQFLLAGGRLPGDGGTPEHAWSIVSLLRDCALSRVLEGVRPDDALPATGFAVVPLDSGSELSLLIAGGADDSGQPLDRVALLIQPAQAAAPTIHDLSSPSRGHPIRLVHPRAGLAAVATPDGNTWLLGGGDARPEVLVSGAALHATWDRLERRKPTMRLIWILDNGGAASLSWFEGLLPDFRDRVVRPLIAEFYTSVRTMVLLAANSDRGLDLDELGVGLGDLADGSGCGDAPMPISIVAAGDLDDVELPGSVVELPSEGQSGPSQGIEEIGKEVDKIFTSLGQDRNGCAWRQFFRRTLDGVEQAGAANTGAVDLSTGITLVLLGTRDDDCSQGVFDGGDGFTGPPPGAGTLADRHCTETAEPWAAEYDAYFGLPPGGPSDEELGRILSEMAWDPADAIFGVFGACNGSALTGCDSERYGALARSRRLLETIGWIGDQGVRTATLDLCDVDSDDDVAALTAEVAELVRGQLPWQACLSLAVAGDRADYDTGKGEFVPVSPESPEAQAVAGLARDLCRAVSVVQSGTDAKYARAIPVDLTPFRAGVDSDRRAGCNTDESGWLFRSGELTTVLGTVAKDAEFVCLP
jgi:hypothetical protein